MKYEARMIDIKVGISSIFNIIDHRIITISTFDHRECINCSEPLRISFPRSDKSEILFERGSDPDTDH